LEGRVPSLLQSLQQRQPSFAPFAQPQPLAFSALQAHLTDTTLLQFFVVRGTLWLLLANQAGIYRHVQLGPLAAVQVAHNALHVAINRALELCKSRGMVATLPFLPALLADVNRQLATLYHLLLAPVADHLPPNQALLILPTDLLYYIPFHALYNGSRYLLEERVVSYAPSATVLHLCARHTAIFTASAGPAQLPTALLFGYGGEQLPQVPAELARLAHCLPQATSRVETNATTAEFLHQAPAHDLIHLAAHAHFRADRPELSALTLADRRLTLAEIARLHLRARLVTLSGCDTGRGQLQGGELLTLAAGFLGAGASALVTSLWRVEDQTTTQLMGTFYQRLLAGLPCAQALQQAQFTLLQQARQPRAAIPWHAHPAFWAPFTVLGDGQVRLA
jgi:CHAT domain-containing protein